MADYTVGKYLAARLEQIGLKHYFMVPGDYNLVLLDELGAGAGHGAADRLHAISM